MVGSGGGGGGWGAPQPPIIHRSMDILQQQQQQPASHATCLAMPSHATRGPQHRRMPAWGACHHGCVWPRVANCAGSQPRPDRPLPPPRLAPHAQQNQQFVRPGFELGFKRNGRYYINNHLVFNILVYETHGEYIAAKKR